MSRPLQREGVRIPEIAPDVPSGLERGLRNYWYPVLLSEELPAGKPVGFKALGNQLVAWRDHDGHPQAVRDKCPHRGAKISAGRVLAGDLQCAWHGLRFNGAGRCTMIPWEHDGSRLLDDVAVKAYPAQELGGYIWVYVGETEKFPAPPLVDVVPEELSKPEEFVIFRHPNEVWNVNWLSALDGADGYHAVILHSESQAVDDEKWTGGRPKKASIPLEKRRMHIVETNEGFRGIVTDEQGKRIQHGHYVEGWKGERWTLPCLYSIPLFPAQNTAAYTARHYQFPIDEHANLSVRFVSMRAQTDDERRRCQQLWDEVIRPRQIELAAEDRAIVETLGDLGEARAEEHLFYPDQEITRLRHRLRDAFLAQLNGERPLPSKEALVYPV